jgi:O-antigen/teichoic acid export membrane protein
MSWGVADQVVSSLTNFAISIYVVHTLGAAQFGAFSLAYVTYGFALGASRGLATDPLMVRFSGVDVPTWQRAVARSTGAATITGLIIGACVLVTAAVMSGVARASFFALGLTLPALLLQDSWRYSFFALGRGSQAFLNDTIWAVSLVPALFLLKKTGHADVFWFVLAWGLTAAVAAAVGPWQARVMPRLSGAWEWVSRQRDLGPRYVLEGITSSVALQLRSWGVVLVLGLAALGAVQASATLFGPITILFIGISLVAIPEGARVLRRSPRHLLPFCLVTTGGLTVAGLAWGIIVLFAVPRGLGAWLLGPIWRSAYPLVLPQMICVICGAMSYGAEMGLHILGASRRSLRQALLWAVLYVTFAVVGAIEGGAEGTVWGAAVAAFVCALYGWSQLHEAMRESGKVPVGRRLVE